MAKKKRNSLWTMAQLIATRGLVAGAGLVVNIIWANAFDQTTYGRYQIVVAAAAVVASFCLPGLNDAALISAARKQDGNLARIVRLRAIASCLGAAVLVGWGILRYADDMTMLLTFGVAAVTFVPLQLQPLWQAFTNGKRRFRALTIGQVVFAVAGLAGVAGFAALGATTPASLPWVFLGVQGMMALVAIGLQLQVMRLRETTDADPSIVHYGHHVTAAMLLAWVFSSDRLIVGEVLSEADVALLSIALVFPNQVKVFFNAFEQVFLPAVTEAKSVAEAWDYMKPRIARLWGAYTVLGVVGFVMLPIVIPAFFSHRYAEAVPYAKWLWLSLCASSPFTFLASILNSQRDRRFLYLKNLANPAILLVLFLVLIPRYGLAGAVGARVVSHGLLVILHVTYFVYALKQSRSAARTDDERGGPDR